MLSFELKEEIKCFFLESEPYTEYLKSPTRTNDVLIELRCIHVIEEFFNSLGKTFLINNKQEVFEYFNHNIIRVGQILAVDKNFRDGLSDIKNIVFECDNEDYDNGYALNRIFTKQVEYMETIDELLYNSIMRL